jgi:hypothetical protein
MLVHIRCVRENRTQLVELQVMGKVLTCRVMLCCRLKH